jgi:hypothetical protein
MKTRVRLMVIIGIVLGLAATGIAVAAGEQEATVATRGPGRGNGQGEGYGGGRGYGRVNTADETGIGTGAGAGAGTGGGVYGVETMTTIDAMPTGTLQTDEIAELLYLWEEEKLARDVYGALGDLYGVPLFSNIARSEQTHMDQVAYLLNRYDLTVPRSESPGAFQNDALAAAYDTLIDQGRESVSEAVAVGIAIEEMDIDDLTRIMQSSENEDVRFVLNQLLMGSQNHLAAFQRQAQR